MYFPLIDVGEDIDLLKELCHVPAFGVGVHALQIGGRKDYLEHIGRIFDGKFNKIKKLVFEEDFEDANNIVDWLKKPYYNVEVIEFNNEGKMVKGVENVLNSKTKGLALSAKMDMNLLCDAIERYGSMEELDFELSDCNDFGRVADLLEKTKKMKRLTLRLSSLKGDPLNMEGVEFIVSSLERSSVETLKVAHCRLTEGFQTELSRCLLKSRIVSIGFEECFGVVNTEFLEKAAHRLICLTISSCEVKFTRDFFLMARESLRFLSVCRSLVSGFESIEEIYRHGPCVLKILDLAFQPIKRVEPIIGVLKGAPLEILNIEASGIKDEEDMLKICKAADGLCSINVKGNPISQSCKSKMTTLFNAYKNLKQVVIE